MIPTKQSRPTGFTLVELLVVIAIIGILVALLLPAVQAARESARRTQCTNQMKNLALAVMNYHDTNGHFPISGGYTQSAGEEPNIVSAASGGADMNCVGWIVQIFPQIEEQALYDQFVAGGAFEGSFVANIYKLQVPNVGIGSTVGNVSVPLLMQNQLSILTCPSDDEGGQLRDDQWQWEDWFVATTNYKGIVGDTWANSLAGSIFNNDASNFPSGIHDRNQNGQSVRPDDLTDADRDCHNGTRCNGVFYRHSWLKQVKLRQVSDGTSKTFMIGEDLPTYNRHSAAYYSNGDWSSCNTPLNYRLRENPEDVRAEWWDSQGFRSLHPGGAMFARVDGSVAFVSDSIDNESYRTSCTRNGDEVVTQN